MKTDLLIPTRPPIARQEQTGRQGLVLVALAAGVFLLMRRDSGNGNGNGNGAQGQVHPSGSIGSVTTEMGSHLVEKLAGQAITTRVSWSATALDSNGSAVRWNFRVHTRVGHNTIFGWREIGRITTGTETGERVSEFFDISTPANRQTFSTFIAPNDPDQEWDVRTELEAARSDANGNPIPEDWIEIATGEHVGAVRTIGGQAAVTGSVGTILVSRRRNGVSLR